MSRYLIKILVTLLLEFKMFELVCLYNSGDHGSSHLELFYEKGLLKYLQNSQENILAGVSFFKKKLTKRRKNERL